jgi:hypothetical protein
MISSAKSEKMLVALKDYKKRYLTKNLVDLDESGTRIMINTFLTSILSYLELEEIKTEFMIKGTYADYIVQTGGKRHFLVEVKAYSLDLSDKHLRQAINYGANEELNGPFSPTEDIFNFIGYFLKNRSANKWYSRSILPPRIMMLNWHWDF